LALGLVLLCAELLTPGIAVLGAGGLLAFLLGSLLLIDSAEPAWQISIALIGATTVSTAGLMALVLWSALRARRQPAASGIEQMIGQTAIATEDFNQTGHVLLQGERWKACSNSPVNAGETVTVVKVDGLTLHIAQDSQLAKNT
jgi:membrane-bound serine protease (ClpP class)